MVPKPSDPKPSATLFRPAHTFERSGSFRGHTFWCEAAQGRARLPFWRSEGAGPPSSHKHFCDLFAENIKTCRRPGPRRDLGWQVCPQTQLQPWVTWTESEPAMPKKVRTQAANRLGHTVAPRELVSQAANRLGHTVAPRELVCWCQLDARATRGCAGDAYVFALRVCNTEPAERGH